MGRAGLLVWLLVAALGLLVPPAALAGVTTRVSVSSSGEQGNAKSENCAISADGVFVAFNSDATNLVSDDTNASSDVFVHYRETGQTTRVSVASDGAQANGSSLNPTLSADGRYVGFRSLATNLVSSDTNGRTDVFVHDRVTGETCRVSVTSSGDEANGNSFSPAVSADGNRVAFSSYATNLVAGDTNGRADVFVHDMSSHATFRVSVASDGTEGNAGGDSAGPSISADGRYVAFESLAYNLAPGGEYGHRQVFLHDCLTGQTVCLSVAPEGAWGDDDSYGPSISAAGLRIAFSSKAMNLVTGDGNGYKNDVLVYDRLSCLLQRVSVASDGTQGTSYSWTPSISADGCQVAFPSDALNLVPQDTNQAQDVFVHSLATGQTVRVSVSSADGQGSGDSYYRPSAISSDGRYVAFGTGASNLVSGDTNGCDDILLRDRYATGTPPGSGGVAGYSLPDGASTGIRNPYDGYSVACRAKGQLHCHYYNDAPHLGGKWSATPADVVNRYGSKGYDFVCLTEHFHCTTGPNVSYPLPINYCEEASAEGKHIVVLGIDTQGCFDPFITSDSGADESRYSPYDPQATTNGLCEVELFASNTIEARVSKVHDWGGIALIAHPATQFDQFGLHFDYRVSDRKILDARPDGMAIYTAAWPTSAEARWDSVLAQGATAYAGGGVPLFGTTEDDYTPCIGALGFARTWVMAEMDTGAVTNNSVMRALKLGRFWSYKAPYACMGTGPVLRLTLYNNGQGKPVVRVVSTESVDDFVFVRRKAHIGRSDYHSGGGTSAEYVCDGDEIYVRVEVKKGAITAYSQPVGIHWNYTFGGTGNVNAASRTPLAGTPADLLITCAQPEELPETMPPLGYIGRAYFVSTSSATYPEGSTLTLSYEGLDVTAYGTSNVAMYRWDSSANAWAKQTSTVDRGNALVAAPLIQAGLYTISAEIVGDTTAPTVMIHTPTDGASLSGPDVVGVQAYDNVGVLRTSFLLGDQDIGTDSTSYDGYTCEYDFSKKAAGTYTLKVVAEDVTGNTGQAEVQVTIVSTGAAPAVAITSPSTGAELEGKATLAGTCSDDSLVAGVFVLADGVPMGEADVTDTNWSFDLDTDLLANGAHTLTAQVMDEDLNKAETSISATVSGQTLGSLAEAKCLADGDRARVAGRAVTFGNPGFEGGFYVEEQQRFSGIRVEGGLVPNQGDMVSVSGVMSTESGEREIVGADVYVISSSNPIPGPLGIGNFCVGGSDTGTLGLQNTGLLVRTWGRVTQIGEDHLYVDDGSQVRDGTFTGAEANVGIRVVCDPTGYAPNDLISVTGIISCFETPSGQLARRVLARSTNDLHRLTGP